MLNDTHNKKRSYRRNSESEQQNCDPSFRNSEILNAKFYLNQDKRGLG